LDCYFALFYDPQMFIFVSTFHPARERSVWISVLDADARNQQLARGCMSRLFIPSDLQSASISRRSVSLCVTLDRVPVASRLARCISCFLRRRTVYIHRDRVRGYAGVSSSSQIFPLALTPSCFFFLVYFGVGRRVYLPTSGRMCLQRVRPPTSTWLRHPPAVYIHPAA
jgi:hypothetical protein